MAHTLIFDIGKTNKKAFLFDKNYQEVIKVYSRFEEQQDEDGFPCDDLPAIQKWIINTVQNILQEGKYKVIAINFSTYGASFVHLDKNGKVLTPLYNYLKPIPAEIITSFYEKYGDEMKIARETASPVLDGLLNSGLQLYWLKYSQPKVFEQIRWSLHFPQYLSYLLTGIPVSEYTSIGCHTMLWDFKKSDYHRWVYEEGIDQILPPIVDTSTSINCRLWGESIKIGVGIHDSSAALLPYIRAEQKPFILISTGTWSISLNAFNQALLTDQELENDCLNFMRMDGLPVKAARLFLGQEYKVQAKELEAFFNTKKEAHQGVRFDELLYQKVSNDEGHYFSFQYLKTPWKHPAVSQLTSFESFEAAYHQLMWELVTLQVAAANLAIGQTVVKKLYIDGGFADNEVFAQLLARYFKDLKLRTTQSPLGSALGAVMVISEKELHKKFLKKNYALKKI
ncbi:MAG: carbohydrate kinase [Saprospiraceae bacterium]|nr:MAG: carbohydrate kinase [Saprospiraceae bacterium]